MNVKHDCPNCQCDKTLPTYPVVCPKCRLLYGPGSVPSNHGVSTCDGKQDIPGATYEK